MKKYIAKTDTMLQIFSENLAMAACGYTKKLNIPVTKKLLKETLIENPYYPSLLSLSNVFNRFNIPNKAFEITDAEFSQLEPPFITFVKTGPGIKDFVLVTDITASNVSYTESGNRLVAISKEQFLQKWEKIVFVAERSESSGEAGFEKNKSEEQKDTIRKAFLLSGSIVSLLLAGIIGISGSGAGILTAVLIGLIKFTGLAATILLLAYETDKSNTFVKNICTAGKQLNCDAVLNSKAAKIAGISWAEAGFFYFAATTLFVVLPGTPIAEKTGWIAAANICVLPYILFSVYYQWRIVKQWCPLCLSVLTVLIMEFAWGFFNYWTLPVWPVITFNLMPAVLFSILFPIVGWYLLKPALTKINTSARYKTAYKRLLYNPQIFSSLLQQERTAAPGYENIGIQLGNPQATTTITKVCNPYCGPCAHAHPVLDEILAHNPNVNVQVIFATSNAENDAGRQVVQHLLAIASLGNEMQTRKALDDWYLNEQKSYPAFAARYPLNGELKMQEEKIEAMFNWCRKAEIQFTPTIFINGKQLPETYSLHELKNIF